MRNGMEKAPRRQANPMAGRAQVLAFGIHDRRKGGLPALVASRDGCIVEFMADEALAGFAERAVMEELRHAIS